VWLALKKPFDEKSIVKSK